MKTVIFAGLAILGTIGNFAHAQTVYSENFDTGVAQLWEPQKLTQWTVSQKTTTNYVYQAKSSKKFNGGIISTYSGSTYKNPDYSVSLRSTTSYATYLLLRATANFYEDWNGITKGSGYAIGISCGNGVGYYYIFVTKDSTTTTIQSWTESSAIICDTTSSGLDWNRLRVKANKDNFKIYINNTLIHTFTDSTITRSGRIGLLGYSTTTTPTTHYFDKVQVSTNASTSTYNDLLPVSISPQPSMTVKSSTGRTSVEF
jgi:hypothetical protein